jgi:WD40 repeat protein
VAFSPDGKRVVTGSADRTVRVWDARTGTTLLELKGFKDNVNGVAFSPDGTRIIAGERGGAVTVWDARAGTISPALKGHTGEILTVAFSPDSAQIVASDRDGTATVWDARTGTPELELKGAANAGGVEFSTDNARIVTGNGPTAKVWDARTRKELPGEVNPDTALAERVSPDGRLFARVVGARVELSSLKS